MNDWHTLKCIRELVVFYDGACPLCKREIAHYQRMHGANRVEWVDITRDSARLSAHGLSFEQAMARFHVLQSDGTWHTGAYGFVALWKHLRALRWLAVGLQRLRLLPLTDWLYTRFARRRLKGRCNGSGCTS
jgi:predicted DCC family thiol-disulfide oxidoreductase YuxK